MLHKLEGFCELLVTPCHGAEVLWRLRVYRRLEERPQEHQSHPRRRAIGDDLGLVAGQALAFVRGQLPCRHRIRRVRRQGTPDGDMGTGNLRTRPRDDVVGHGPYGVGIGGMGAMAAGGAMDGRSKRSVDIILHPSRSLTRHGMFCSGLLQR